MCGAQLKIYELEKRMGVPQRQQFPFFEEMHWYDQAPMCQTTFATLRFLSENVICQKMLT